SSQGARLLDFHRGDEGLFPYLGDLLYRMATITDIPLPKHKREVVDRAVIRFAGDSGDGMQVTGSQFTNTVALYGNHMATFPHFPAEIRAPAGTLPGVSG